MFERDEKKFCAGLAAAVGVPPKDVVVTTKKTHYFFVKVPDPKTGKLVPDPNHKHWVATGVDVTFKIMVTKAYAWDTAVSATHSHHRSLLSVHVYTPRRLVARERVFAMVNCQLSRRRTRS